MNLRDQARCSNREPPSTRIVREVAAAEGIDPADLTPPLYESIDTDAVDALFAAAGSRPPPVGARVTFSYHGYLVCVDGTGDVTVQRVDDENGAARR